MTQERAPAEIRELAHARSAARAARDWAVADRLRGEIQTAGWTVIDNGTDFALRPTDAPDVIEDGRVRYGSSKSVPARFDEPPVGPASVVLLASAWADDLRRALDGVAAHFPAGTQAIVVSGPDATDTSETIVEGRENVELVLTSVELGHAASLNAAIRHSASGTVVLLDTSVEPVGDAIGPLVEALADPAVAVAGAWGIESSDLRRFREAPPGEVDAIEAYCMAFRRADYAARGPLDERFRFYRNLDIWWSLVLRDEGVDQPSRKAIALPDLPLRGHEHRGYTSVPEVERERLSKRNFYRIIDRFGDRRDLIRRAG